MYFVRSFIAKHPIYTHERFLILFSENNTVQEQNSIFGAGCCLCAEMSALSVQKSLSQVTLSFLNGTRSRRDTVEMQHIDVSGDKYKIFWLHPDAKRYVRGDAETWRREMQNQPRYVENQVPEAPTFFLPRTLSTFKHYFYLSLPALRSHVTSANFFPTHRKLDTGTVVSAKSKTHHTYPQPLPFPLRRIWDFLNTNKM